MSKRFNTVDEGVRALWRELDSLKTEIKAMRGDGGAGIFTGDIILHGNRVRRASPSEEQDDYVTRGELEDAMGAHLLYQVFATGGTSYTLNHQAAWILMFVNGDLMEKDATGNLGYTVDLDGGSGRKTLITTNRSFATTDYVLVLYVKAAL